MLTASLGEDSQSSYGYGDGYGNGYGYGNGDGNGDGNEDSDWRRR